MPIAIKIEKLSKAFIARETFPGIFGTIKGLFFGKNRELIAIQELSFEIATGERVASIGPNGAGKSTTIKMLIGILHPTSGVVEALGFTPWKDRNALGYQSFLCRPQEV